MEKIHISVVIPTYNRAGTISDCIKSVLAQTYEDLDVIVVDDCSEDNTINIVRSFSDPRVRCIGLPKNSGAQAARNRGILEAKGDWIAFQDSDDEWLPEKLEKQVSVLGKAHYDPWFVVYSNVFLYDTVRRENKVWLLPVIEGDNQYATLLQYPAPLYQTMLVSRLALEKIGFLDEQVPSFQEWDTSIRLAKYCKFIHMKESLVIYHVGQNKAISSSNKRHIEGWNYIIRKYQEDITEFCGVEGWFRVNIELLNRCLKFGMIDCYDKHRYEIGLSDANVLTMFYLLLCRKLHLQSNNVIYRIVHKLYGIFLEIKQHVIRTA